jgi:hypothetical protein
MGDDLTHWTVRLALAAYVASVALLLVAPSSRSAKSVARWCWTLACLACVAHVVCAFHFQHGWSHAAAYDHVAERTFAVIGWNWGGGLYINYAFLLLWLADAGWWWLSPGSYAARPRTLHLLVHGFVLFIVFNATVVFGEGWVRVYGTAGLLALLAAASCRPFRNPLGKQGLRPPQIW